MSHKKPSVSRKLLKMRKRAKRKKPEFHRSESWRYSKLSESWRRPRGLDHKMRRKIKGWPPMVSTGYKGPKIARGLHPSGFREVLVHNVNEVTAVDPRVQAVRIAGTVGKRKRVLIVAEAKKQKIVVLNPGVEEAGVKLGEEAEELVEPEEVEERVSEKPKRRLFGRRRKTKKETKPSKKKVEQPKRTRKTSKTEEGDEAQ